MSTTGHPPNHRKEIDVMKLLKGSKKVYLSGNISEFWVEFVGPEGTPYEEGTWILHVLLPPDYPFKSPSIGFSNRILHPNIDEASGSVCLDVINQTWTPMYELKNIFDVFLPQLLRYPNPEDPLNPSAAQYLQRDPIGYVTMLQEHVAIHGTREKALASIPFPYGPSSQEDDSDNDSYNQAGDVVNGNIPIGSSNGYASLKNYSENVLNTQENNSEIVENVRVDQLYQPEEEEFIPEEIEI